MFRVQILAVALNKSLHSGSHSFFKSYPMFMSLLTVQDSAVNYSTEAISGSDLFLLLLSSLSLFDLTVGP